MILSDSYDALAVPNMLEMSKSSFSGIFFG